MDYKQGINNFIVQTKGRYEKQIGNTDLIRPDTIDNSHYLYLEGEVIASPKELPLKKGTTIYFNYVVTRESTYGKNYCLDKENNIFRVPYREEGIDSMVFAYKDETGVKAVNDWLFIEPITEELETTESGLVLVKEFEGKFYESGEQKPKELYGKVKYIGDDFEDFDIKVGDTIICKPGHEFEMNIDGELLYRVWKPFVLAKAV